MKNDTFIGFRAEYGIWVCENGHEFKHWYNGANTLTKIKPGSCPICGTKTIYPFIKPLLTKEQEEHIIKTVNKIAQEMHKDIIRCG